MFRGFLNKVKTLVEKVGQSIFLTTDQENTDFSAGKHVVFDKHVQEFDNRLKQAFTTTQLNKKVQGVALKEAENKVRMITSRMQDQPSYTDLQKKWGKVSKIGNVVEINKRATKYQRRTPPHHGSK